MLNHLYKNHNITFIDYHFARLIQEIAPASDPGVLLGAALVSRVTGQGHVCLNLREWAGNSPVDGLPASKTMTCPDLDLWREQLLSCPAVGRPGEFFPLILDQGDRLYLHRYWDYEQRLAAGIRGRVEIPKDRVDPERLKAALNRFFPVTDRNVPDNQKLAALVAASHRLCVISGGPGTGKTTTAAKILGLLAELARPEPLRAVLCAPTGKAAMRLAEAMDRFQNGPSRDEILAEALPSRTYTIHRLLGAIPGSPYFRHHAENPLAVDVVIVDEASMVDIALMSKLMEAIPERATVLLMGDKDQLASVEAGAVLGDICGRETGLPRSEALVRLVRQVLGDRWVPEGEGRGEDQGLRDHLVRLNRNYRFPDQSPISRFSRAVNQGKAEAAIQLLREGAGSTVRWGPGRSGAEGLGTLVSTAVDGYQGVFDASNPDEALMRFDRTRVLCAVRKGPLGVEGVNRAVEEGLRDLGLVDRPPSAGFPDRGFWYRGRPILITRNDYLLRLFNGDVGITFPDPEDGGMRVFFRTGEGRVRGIAPHRLPEHETAWAMTVHKSQGSEFAHVLLVLPETDTPVLTRELIYTAVTRARESVTIWGGEALLAAAVQRRIQRTSGLRDALWGAAHP